MTDMQELKQELDQIWQELHTKQDRIKPAVAVTFLIWIVGATVSGVWWAATTTSQLRTLQQVVVDGTKAQYSISTAVQDFRLRDQRLDFLQQQIDTHQNSDKEAHRQFRDQLNAHEQKIRELELRK